MLDQEDESQLKARLREMMLDLVEEFDVGFSVVIDPQGSNVRIETRRHYSAPDVCATMVRHAVYVENDDGIDRVDILSSSMNILFETFRRLNMRTNYSSYAKRAIVVEKLVAHGRNLSRYMSQQRLSEDISYASFLRRLNEDVLGHTFGVGNEYIYIDLSTSTLAKRYLPQLKNLRGEYANRIYNRIIGEISAKFDATYEEDMVEDEEDEEDEEEEEFTPQVLQEFQEEVNMWEEDEGESLEYRS